MPKSIFNSEDLVTYNSYDNCHDSFGLGCVLFLLN